MAKPKFTEQETRDRMDLAMNGGAPGDMAFTSIIRDMERRYDQTAKKLAGIGYDAKELKEYRRAWIHKTLTRLLDEL